MLSANLAKFLHCDNGEFGTTVVSDQYREGRCSCSGICGSHPQKPHPSVPPLVNPGNIKHTLALSLATRTATTCLPLGQSPANNDRDWCVKFLVTNKMLNRKLGLPRPPGRSTPTEGLASAANCFEMSWSCRRLWGKTFGLILPLAEIVSHCVSQLASSLNVNWTWLFPRNLR